MKSFDGYLKLKLGNDYVLLAGGSHKALSDFSMSHSHPYLPLSGGTMTGIITGNTGNGLIVQSTNTGSWKEGIRVYPASDNYSLISLQSSDSKNIFAMVTNVSSLIAYFDYYKDGVGKNIYMPYDSGTLALTKNIPTHWANLPLQSSADLTTLPTFGKVFINNDYTTTNTSFLDCNNNGYASNSFTWGLNLRYSKLIAGSRVINLIGKANSVYNQAYFGYYHQGDASTTNFATIGMYGADLLFNVLANGKVGVGTTSPAYKLTVAGDIQAISSALEVGIRVRNTNTAASSWSIIRMGNGGYDTGPVMFFNSASRTDDGGANTFTIRNNVGKLRLGSTSYVSYFESKLGIKKEPSYSLDIYSVEGTAIGVTKAYANSGYMLRAFNSSLPSGYNEYIEWGQAASTRNSAHIAYCHRGAGSTSSFLSLGLYAVDYVLNITGAAKVGIGTQSPGSKLTVTDAGDIIQINSTSGSYTCVNYTLSGYTSWSAGITNKNKFYFWNSNQSRHVVDIYLTGRVDVIGTAGATNGIFISQSGSYNYHPIYGDTAGRPGISISGNYPYIWLTGGGVSNAQHGATITLCSPDSVAGTNGAFKTWTFGVPGQGGTWMDLAYSYNYGNPHNGINGWAGSGSPSRVMRWTTALTFVYGVGNDMASTLTVTSSRADTWVYGASFLAPNIASSQNVAIFIGQAHSTRNSFGWTHYQVGAGSTSNYCALEIWGVGNAFQMRYDKVATFLGNVNAPNYYTTSDARKKLNIHKISDNIKQFEWKETGETSYGFVAQDLEVKHPELVNDDGNMKTVNYNAALSLVVAKLENRVKELEAKLGIESSSCI